VAAITVYSAPEDGREGRCILLVYYILHYRLMMHGNLNIKFIITCYTSPVLRVCDIRGDFSLYYKSCLHWR